jgi:transmembrane 9 superfamily member 2/4
MWGFTGISFVLICISVIEVTIVIVYLTLCNENYEWYYPKYPQLIARFWRSFVVGASSSLYIFAYSIWYMLFRLKITGFVPRIVYLFYSSSACFLHGMICGTLGFLGAYIFVWRIYGYSHFIRRLTVDH